MNYLKCLHILRDIINNDIDIITENKFEVSVLVDIVKEIHVICLDKEGSLDETFTGHDIKYGTASIGAIL